ncbi:MAG: type II secretion system protein [Lachnospiraceae bacterium]|nr:type II secretion system protein [Lachnospiraceae bacterium]
MVKKSWEKKVDNKGFTLVELIVVLVILAILAAILVPALLGYIDRAKGSQLVLNGKSVLTAAQAEASNAYGTAKDAETIATKFTADICKRIGETADTPDDSGAWFSTGVTPAKAEATDAGHKAFTIKYCVYWEGDKGIYFNGSSWEEGLTKDAAQAAFTSGDAADKHYGSFTKASGTVTGVAYTN